MQLERMMKKMKFGGHEGLKIPWPHGRTGSSPVSGTRETEWQDYGYRFYNPLLGRFLATDPLANSFAWLTTYHGYPPYKLKEPIRHIK